MNRSILIIIALVVVLGGGGAYFAINAKNNHPKNQPQPVAQSDNPIFNPIPTEGLSFEAKMTSEANSEMNLLLQNDGKGNRMSQSKVGGDTISLYVLGGEYLMCTNSTCQKLPKASQQQVQANANADYDQDKIKQFSQNATYKGEQPCGSDTCKVWQVANSSFNGSFYIDSSNRIVKITGDTDNKGWTMDFTYKPVKIERPKNITEAPEARR